MSLRLLSECLDCISNSFSGTVSVDIASNLLNLLIGNDEHCHTPSCLAQRLSFHDKGTTRVSNASNGYTSDYCRHTVNVRINSIFSSLNTFSLLNSNPSFFSHFLFFDGLSAFTITIRFKISTGTSVDSDLTVARSSGDSGRGSQTIIK